MSNGSGPICRIVSMFTWPQITQTTWGITSFIFNLLEIFNFNLGSETYFGANFISASSKHAYLQKSFFLCAFVLSSLQTSMRFSLAGTCITATTTYYSLLLLTTTYCYYLLLLLTATTYCSYLLLLLTAATYCSYLLFLLTAPTYCFYLLLLLTPTTYSYYLLLLLTPTTYSYYLPLLLTPTTYSYYLLLLLTATTYYYYLLLTTTIIVIVKEKEPLCHKIKTVHINQGKFMFEKWCRECTNQDLNNLEKWNLLINLAICRKQINLIIFT